MSEDVKPYGAPSTPADEPTPDELRTLIARTGLSQRRAAESIDVSERMMRYYASGQEKIPRVVLYAMRYLAEHAPNQVRWLQVHWEKVGREVAPPAKRVEIRAVDGDMRFIVNGEVLIRGRLDDLVRMGVVSVHTTQADDRHLWSV